MSARRLTARGVRSHRGARGTVLPAADVLGRESLEKDREPLRPGRGCLRGTVMLPITVAHFASADLKDGNAAKGIVEGVGAAG